MRYLLDLEEPNNNVLVHIHSLSLRFKRDALLISWPTAIHKYTCMTKVRLFGTLFLRHLQHLVRPLHRKTRPSVTRLVKATFSTQKSAVETHPGLVYETMSGWRGGGRGRGAPRGGRGGFRRGWYHL